MNVCMHHLTRLLVYQCLPGSYIGSWQGTLSLLVQVWVPRAVPSKDTWLWYAAGHSVQAAHRPLCVAVAAVWSQSRHNASCALDGMGTILHRTGIKQCGHAATMIAVHEAMRVLNMCIELRWTFRGEQWLKWLHSDVV